MSDLWGWLILILVVLIILAVIWWWWRQRGIPTETAHMEPPAPAMMTKAVPPMAPASVAAVPVADDLTIVARTDVDSASMVPLLRDAIRSIDPTVALYDIETMERRVEASVAPQRLDVWLLTFFGVVALLLAAVGVYGVVAFSVRSRLREIGIRVALGAHGRDVVRLGLADGIVPAMAGLGVGLILALAFGRWLSALLFDTAANDAATLVSVAGLLMAVALLASYLPARRAMRVDPIAILRAE
jgi:putative ABC transport system permease protein